MILRILLLFFTCFIYQLSFAEITFEVTHKVDSSYKAVAPEFLPLLSVRMSKRPNGAHATRVEDVSVGQTASSYVSNIFIFAPDDSGDYDIAIDCNGIASNYVGQSCSSGRQIISVQDGSTVRIEASCMVNKDSFGIPRSVDDLTYTIKVDNKYIVGSAESSVHSKNMFWGYWRHSGGMNICLD